MSDDIAIGPWPYSVLQLPDDIQDKKVVKRAYAKLLKQLDQEKQQSEFQELRQAYEICLSMCDVDRIVQHQTLVQTELEAPLDLIDAPMDAQPSDVSPALDDMSKYLAVIEKIPMKSIVEADEQRIVRLINSLDLLNPTIRSQAESAVMQYFEDALVPTDEDSYCFTSNITMELLQFCDETFGWMTDAVGWEDRMNPSGEFVIALAVGMQIDTEQVDEYKIPYISKLGEWLFDWRIWTGWLILTFLILTTSRLSGLNQEYHDMLFTICLLILPGLAAGATVFLLVIGLGFLFINIVSICWYLLRRKFSKLLKKS